MDPTRVIFPQPWSEPSSVVVHPTEKLQHFQTPNSMHIGKTRAAIIFESIKSRLGQGSQRDKTSHETSAHRDEENDLQLLDNRETDPTALQVPRFMRNSNDRRNQAAIIRAEHDALIAALGDEKRRLDNTFSSLDDLNTDEPFNTTPPAEEVDSSNPIETLKTFLDHNQHQQLQHQAIALLNNVPAFSGALGTRFDNWVRHFEACTALADFEESRKILILQSKLTSTAADTFQQFQKQDSVNAKSFIKIKECLHKRFHGNETHMHYAEQFAKCVRADKESVRDYASRLTKIFQYCYPEFYDDSGSMPSQFMDTLLMDKFRAGLQRKIGKKIATKKFSSMEKMIECVECHLVEERRDEEERQAEVFIRSVQDRPTFSSYPAPVPIQQLGGQVQQDLKNDMKELKIMLRCIIELVNSRSSQMLD